ncbi:MAG: glycosyltransferase [Propioniciclava sp.]
MRIVPGHSRESGPARALIASRIYAPEPGAAPLRLAALHRALDRVGLVTDVLTSTPGHHAPASTAGLDPFPGRMRRWPVIRNTDGYLRGYLGYLSFDIPLFFRLLASRRPAVLVVEPPPTTGLVGLIGARLRRVPFVYYAPDIWSVASQSAGSPAWVTQALRAMETMVWRQADAILTVFPELAARITEAAPTAHVHVVGHGADLQTFTPEGPTQILDHPYLVYAGTASEVHGARIFMEALPQVLTQVPHARVVVIGHGEERPVMERLARKLPPGTVTFLPRLSPQETAAWIRGSRATLASVRPGPYGFALATKVYASVGCGVPVVYVGEGEGDDLVSGHDLGWVAPYQTAATATQMVTALTTEISQPRREQLRAWAQTSGSLDAAADRGAEVITHLLAPGATPGVRPSEGRHQ